MKALVATIFAAGVSLTTLSSAQAITVTAAPLAEAAKETSSVVEVQGCGRVATMMASRGCRSNQLELQEVYAKKEAQEVVASVRPFLRCGASQYASEGISSGN